MHRRAGRLAATAAAALLITSVSAATGALPASAALAHTSVVSEVPAATTPHVEDDASAPNSAVHAFVQVGDVMYAGGKIRTVRSPDRSLVYQRHHLFSFAVNTGQVSAWRPVLTGGEVLALAATATHLYVGGSFTEADGRPGRLVRYSLATGLIDEEWTPAVLGGQVLDLEVVGGRLFVAGSFPGALRALDPATGADTGYLNHEITGTLGRNSGSTRVTRFAVDPTGSRLLAIGNFVDVDGERRERAFMLDLLEDGSSLNRWYYAYLRRTCINSEMVAYLRDVDFSPDGSYFVLVSTGSIPRRGGLGTDLCDAAARFETDDEAPRRPTWINYTGGDTLLSVAITGAAVYVGGHQRWMDNPYGYDSCGFFCVERPGVGAIHPVTGRALPWNPTKSRGVGTRAIYATPTGVWFGSDGRYFGGEVHDGIAFTPLPAAPVPVRPRAATG